MVDWHESWSDERAVTGLDVNPCDVPHALRARVRELLHAGRDGHEKIGEWYLRLRELYGEALLRTRRPVRYDETALRVWGETIEALRGEDARVLSRLRRLGAWDARALLAAESERLAAALGPGVPAAPPPLRVDDLWSWLPGTKSGRGPDRAPRARRGAPAGASLRDRVLRLLGRHPEGLSANGVRQKLRARRDAVQKILETLRGESRVDRVGSRNDSRWLLRS